MPANEPQPPAPPPGEHDSSRLAVLTDRLQAPAARPRSAEHFRRSQLVVITSLLLGSLSLVFIVVSLATRTQLHLLPVPMMALVCFAACLYLVWRRGAVDMAARVLCLSALAGIGGSAWMQGGNSIGAAPAMTMTCLCAVFLVGRGFAWACAAASIANSLAVTAAVHFGMQIPPIQHHAGVELFLFAFVLAFVCLFAGLYQRSLEQALGERGAALNLLSQSEADLAALIENSDAAIWSMDRELRLVAGNSAFRGLCESMSVNPPPIGHRLRDWLPASERSEWAAAAERALAGERLSFERSLGAGESQLHLEVSLNPLRDVAGQVSGVTVFARDITDRRRSQRKVESLHQELVRASHFAGMAEVATGVLHNVGNVLNSLNTSAGVVTERLRGSKVPFVSRSASLLQLPPAELTDFLLHDERGQKLPEYIANLGEHLETERLGLLDEMQNLNEHLHHVKSIIAMQQSYAKVAGVVERLHLSDVLEDALAMLAGRFHRHEITVLREYAELPPVSLERHKLLQIFTNLLGNAADALTASSVAQRLLTVRTYLGEGGQVQIEVADNGVGIAPENQVRIFGHGFTTRKDGHGFGLHTCALAARSMNGTLRCHSDGEGRGATFTLAIPFEPAEIAGRDAA